MNAATAAVTGQGRTLPAPPLYLGDAKSLWVLNKWHTHLSFTLEGRNGVQQLITLPRTWIPLDLSQYAEVDKIESSPFFRRMLGQGLVEIIPTEEAHKKLSKEGALEEQQRILTGRTSPQAPGRGPVQSEVQGESASPEDIAMANLEGASEADAVNRMKLLEGQGAITMSLKRKVLTYAEARGFPSLKSIVEGMVANDQTDEDA